MTTFNPFTTDFFKRPRHLMMKTGCLCLLVFGIVCPSHAGVNVLIIGSSRHFDAEESGKQNTRPNPKSIAEELEKIANNGMPQGATQVVFKDVYRTKITDVALGSRGKLIPTQFHCHSLAQFYFWPDGREDQLSLLRGKSGPSWDYVILMGDPYLISAMPGIYAEGVYHLSKILREDPNTKLILLMPWLEKDTTVVQISEVVYRVGLGFGIPVAPAGETVTATDGLRTGNASYIAAASIFSTLSGRQAWGHPLFSKNALNTVIQNRSKPVFTEPFSHPTPFTMSFRDDPVLTYHHTGTSSERGIRRGIIEALNHGGLQGKEVKTPGPEKIDFNYGRGNSNFEAEKRYKVDPSTFHRSYGFPMQESNATASVSMLYGIDKRYFRSNRYDDGTDLGIAYDMVREDEDQQNVRAIPIRLLWAQLQDEDPTLTPLRDTWHMSRLIDAASGAYMVTLLTGKDPRGQEPVNKSSEEWIKWQARNIGYQTAMRMGLKFNTLEK